MEDFVDTTPTEPAHLYREPKIYSHKHGYYNCLVCSDYTYHNLTLLDRLFLKIGLTNVNELNEKYRLDKPERPGN